MESATCTMHSSYSKPFTLKQTYIEMITNTGASATCDSHEPTESLKRRKLNSKMYTLQVVEQPKSVGLRFVKSGQSPTPGSYIMGEKSSAGKATHPSLLLTKYKGPVTLVWYLVASDVKYPHPYILEGEDCEGGVCTKTIMAEGQIISFPGLYVRCVARREVQKVLERRLGILKKHLPGTEFKKKDTIEYNLGTARICFQALLLDYEGSEEMLKSVLTRSLHSKELSLEREPLILSISQCKGSVHGREELSLQVTNLQNDDVMVFFHCENLVPRTSWQAFAEVISVSRKKAQHVNIVVRTPPYHNQHITEPETVAVHVRLIDNSASNTVKYTYTPQAKGVSRIEQRVKQKEPIYVSYYSCLGAVAPMHPVLEIGKLNGYDTNLAECSQGTMHVPMFVCRREENKQQANRKRKPLKMNAGTQTNKRDLKSEDGLEGYDSEEELGAGENRVDYDRLYWYRSLMMGSKSPSDSGKREEKKDDTAPIYGTESRPQKGVGLSRTDFTPSGLLGSFRSSASDKSEGSCSAQSQGVSPSGLSDNSSSIKSENALRMMQLPKLQSLSLREEGTSFPLLDTCESIGNTDGHFCNPDLPKEFGSCRQRLKSPVEGVHEDIQFEKEDSTPSKPNACPTSATKWPLGSQNFVLHNKIMQEFTEHEVVQEPLGENNHPDISKSNLVPATLLHENQLVAIKKITKSNYQEEAYSLWHTLNHDSLIPLLGVVKDKGSISLILKFPVLGCLQEYLSRTDSCPLPWETQMNWIQQVAEGLGHLHQNGLAHREVRLENCLISEDSNLMLSIPSALVVARSHLEGKALELKSVSDEKFEKTKAYDVYSFGVVMWQILTSQDTHLAQTASKLHMNSKDSQQSSLLSLSYECQHEDESQRPAILEIIRKLQNLRQQRPETSMTLGAPYLSVQHASPDHTFDEQETIRPNAFGDLYESMPKTPDSGVYVSQSGKEKECPTAGVTLPVVSEQTDSVASGESAFSDGSQRSRNNGSTEQAESGVADSSGFGVSQAASLTNSEVVKVADSASGLQEMQESDDSQGHENRKADDKSTGGGQEDSDRQDKDYTRDGSQDEVPGSHLCPPRVTKQVGHTGGVLELLNGEISLQIPPGALREGQVEDVTLTIDWNNKHIPPLNSSDMNVAPIVQCGPTGLKFEKPVLLRIPHCAVMSDPKQCKMTVHYSQTDEGEQPEWERISKQDNPDMEVECQDRCFLLHISHFSSFTVSLKSGEETLAKEIMFVAYGHEVSSLEMDQNIRLYLYDNHGSNRENVHQEEQKFCGKLLYTPKSYHFHELHQGNMVISVEYQDLKWLLKSALTNTFLFHKIWNLRSFDQCKFIWSNHSQAVKFMCRFVAQQDRNDEQSILEISNDVKMSPDQSSCSTESTKYLEPTSASLSGCMGLSESTFAPVAQCSSWDSGNSSVKRVSLELTVINFVSCIPSGPDEHYACGPPPLIPNDLKQKLCQKLDVKQDLCNDWRQLASDLGYGGLIKLWESKQSMCPNFSPTEKLLERIEQQQKVKSLDDLEEYLRKMQRPDVADIIADYRSSHTATEEPLTIEPPKELLAIEPLKELMNTSLTPSPDDINRPLTAEQRPFDETPEASPPDIAQRCPGRGRASCRQNGPSSTNWNETQPRVASSERNGTAMSGLSLSKAEGPSSDACRESVPSTEPDHRPPQSRGPTSTPDPPVLNCQGVPENPHAAPEGVTPWSLCRLPGSQIDENKNMEDLEHGINRMLTF